MANFITLDKHHAMTIEEIKEEQKNHRATIDALIERTKTPKVKTEKSGLRIGEIITVDDIEKLYLTANANAKSATEIKRDHMTAPSKFMYLDKTVDAHNKLFYTMNNGGHARGYDADAKTPISKQEEDAHDGVQSAVVPLLENIGKEYTADIRKASRNAVDKLNNDKNRAADDMNAVSIEGEREKAGDAFDALVVGDLFGYSDDTFSAVVRDALEKLPTEYAVIVCRICSGDTQTDIASDLNRSQSYVAKKYKIAIEQLKQLLILENGRVKAR